MPFSLGFWAAAGAGGADAGAYELIETITFSGSSVGAYFTNIPQGYKHLQARLVMKSQLSAANHSINMQVNDAAGTSYSSHRLFGSGSQVFSQVQATSSNIMEIGFASAASYSNDFGAYVVDILDYTSSSKNKTVRSFGGHLNAGSTFVSLYSGAYLATTAVSKLYFFVGGGGTNLVAGSHVSLYGIKG